MSHITLITSGRMQDSLLRQLIDYIIKRDWWFGCFVLKSIANYLMNSIETLLHIYIYGYKYSILILGVCLQIGLSCWRLKLKWQKSPAAWVDWNQNGRIHLLLIYSPNGKYFFFYGHTYFWNKTCHPNNKQTKIPQSKMNQPCFSLINTSLLNFTLLELFLCLRYCPLAYICI